MIVGGDSLVGAALYKALERRGRRVYATTRRKATVGGRRIYMDLLNPALTDLAPDVGYAFIVAGISTYDRCESDPDATTINVKRIPELAARLLERGLCVSFISTNAVFGGERLWPAEEDDHAPAIAYARQKHEAELKIQDVADRLAVTDQLSIVRLTKVLADNTPPLPNWFAAWRRREAVEPFADLVFAPISQRFAGEALATIGERAASGSFHLSGAENVTYVDLAHNLAQQLGVDQNLIRPTTATERGIRIAFQPRYSGLGMRRTGELCGLQPQRLSDVVRDLVEATDLRVERRKSDSRSEA